MCRRVGIQPDLQDRLEISGPERAYHQLTSFRCAAYGFMTAKRSGIPELYWSQTHKMMTTQTPGGPGPPCCMNVGSGDAVPVDFYEEKIGKFSGGLGAKPPASLCVLSPRGERTWPRIGYPFSLGQRFICADKLQHAPQKRVWPAGHPLSLHKERGKRSARGSPPGPSPGVLIFRAIVGHHNGR